MVPWRATEEGFVTPEVLSWYERFAQGRPGAIVVEATGIRDIPSGPLLRIGHDRFLPGLEKLVKTVEKASGGETRLLIQVIDFLVVRRRPDPGKYIRKYLEISDHYREELGAIPDGEIRETLLAMTDEERAKVMTPRDFESLQQGFRERVTDMEQDHIRDLPKTLPGIFAQAAGRAEKAGFDGVELHYAHAYTMASFLSALNDRPDPYGGSRENRVRLPLEVYCEVRNTVSDSFAVGCRYLAEECIPGGNTVDEAQFFGVEFAKAGMDFLSLSRGGKFEDAKQPAVGWSAYPYTGPSGYECMPTVLSDEEGPFGRNVEASRRIRDAVRSAGLDTPIALQGGICSFSQAEGILERGEADIVGAARQSLADPDWFRKIRLGKGIEVRRCEYTNYCEGLDQKHKTVTCKLWDRVDLDEAGVQKTPDGYRRLTAPPWQMGSEV
jgi:2,4-dienoyl-CoA reductase-like NADH-dependent reductase (Old Yellow Enzyme family)